MNLMKVIHVISDTNIGGAGRWLLNYIKYYDKSKITLKVILPENSKLKELIAPYGIQIFEVPYMADCSFNRKAVGYIKKILEEEMPDILHTHASLSARIAGRSIKGLKIINTRHCLETVSTGIKSRIKNIINLRYSDYFIAVCHAVEYNFVAGGIPHNKIRVVYNGVEPVKKLTEEERREIREKFGVDENTNIIGIMARIEPVKGHETLIEAVARMKSKDFKLIIAGCGSLEDEMKQLAESLDIQDKVLFAGYLKDTTELLNIMDINVLASESEAMSLAILESMSMAIPTVATDVGGNDELIVSGETGLLVKYGDSSEMADALDILLESQNLREKYGNAAKERFEKEFTAELAARVLEKVYEEVV